MEFAHAAHREAHERVEEYLGELFEDPYLDRENAHFYVRYGTTVLEIAVDPYGPDETMVQVMAYCVQGARLEPDLMMGLLELNHHLAFAAFSAAGRASVLSHTLFGRRHAARQQPQSAPRLRSAGDRRGERAARRHRGEVGAAGTRAAKGQLRRLPRRPGI